MKQKDVADVMGITTVSVGQYVESGFAQIAKEYFAEENQRNAKTGRK
jgi:predicted transcriptional regulator